MTEKGMLPIRTVCPAADPLAPKSRLATVTPRTATFVPVSTSDWVKRAPCSMAQFRISKYSGVVPETLDVQLSSPETIDWLDRSCGAAALTEGSSSLIAVRSSQVNVGIDP